MQRFGACSRSVWLETPSGWTCVDPQINFHGDFEFLHTRRQQASQGHIWVRHPTYPTTFSEMGAAANRCCASERLPALVNMIRFQCVDCAWNVLKTRTSQRQATEAREARKILIEEFALTERRVPSFGTWTPGTKANLPPKSRMCFHLLIYHPLAF